MTKRKKSEYELFWDKANQLGPAIDQHKLDLKKLNSIDIRGKYVTARKRRIVRELARLNNELTPAKTSGAVIWQRAAIVRARKFLINSLPVNSRSVAETVRNETASHVTDLTVDKFLNKIGWLLKKRGRPSK